MVVLVTPAWNRRTGATHDQKPDRSRDRLAFQPVLGERVARGFVGVHPIREAEVLHVHCAGGAAVGGEEMPFPFVKHHRRVFESDIGVGGIFGRADEARRTFPLKFAGGERGGIGRVKRRANRKRVRSVESVEMLGKIEVGGIFSD